MNPRISPDIIVMGGSAGALQALRELLSAAPAELDASIFVVLDEGLLRAGSGKGPESFATN